MGQRIAVAACLRALPAFGSVLVLVPALLISSTAVQAASKAEFLAEYEPAARKLEDFYTNLHMVATSTKTGWAAYDGAPHVERIEFFARDNLFRIDGTKVTQDGQITARVAAAQQSFLVTKKSERHGFVLESLDTYGSRLESIRLTYPFVIAPFGYYEYTLLRLFATPELTLTAVDDITDKGERLRKVSYEWPSQDGSRVAVGWFLLAVDDSFVVREYSTGSGTKHRAKLIYNGKMENVPLLKEVHYWREAEDGSRSVVEDIVVEKIAREDIAEAEFTLSAFGIPNIHADGAVNRTGYYVLGLGAVALIAAALLHRLSARRRRAS